MKISQKIYSIDMLFSLQVSQDYSNAVCWRYHRF